MTESRVRGRRAITVYVSRDDDQAIEMIKARTGIRTAADAVRFAIRMLAIHDIHLLNAADGIIEQLRREQEIDGVV